MMQRQIPSDRALFLYLGALLLIAASLGEAVWNAVESGTVTVMQVGKYSTATEVVPWIVGWSRFAGPLLLLGALETWRRWKRFWTALSMTLAGLTLIVCSIWFTSLERLAGFILWGVFIVTSLAIGKRFGWLAVFGFVGASLAVAVWVQAHV